jgi:hypothetical protein
MTPPPNNMADNDGWNTVSHKHKLTPRNNEDDDGGDFVVYSPPKKKTNTEEANASKRQSKFVLILVGIPGSGKSTFATKLEKVSTQYLFDVIIEVIALKTAT